MNIIDETYNGEKYPIIERDYNAYFFPENFNPDNEEDQAERLANSYKKGSKDCDHLAGTKKRES